MNALSDKGLIQAIASELGVHPSFVEKDWHAVHLVGLVGGLNIGGIQPVFSGGTSLSKGYGLIQRFSEDVDFKLLFSEDNTTRSDRRAYREHVVTAINATDIWSVNHCNSQNESRTFRLQIDYRGGMTPSAALRPHLRLDVSFVRPTLAPDHRSIRSFVAEARGEAAEVVSVPCVAPVETAADKLSSLAWRVLKRQRGGGDDDGTFIRHLHDVAALAAHVSDTANFKNLLKNTLETDSARAGASGEDMTGADLLAAALDILETDADYMEEYDKYVMGMSYAATGKSPDFQTAIEAARRLAACMRDHE